MVAKTQNTQFAKDVLAGLSKSPKRLSSKYFYDKKGDKIFQKIMAMPEYYLTRSELEVLQIHQNDILKAIGDQPFDLIEMGAGDGYKTKVLLRNFVKKGVDFRYLPIDISAHILEELSSNLADELPDLTTFPLQGDYFKALEKLPKNNGRKKVVLFMGSNIGNFSESQAKGFVQKVSEVLDKGDAMIIGFDLKKNPQTILDAYNDAAGITSDFNLNLLDRMNRELGADFKVDQFQHWENYDPVTGETKSFIVSKQDQEVSFSTLEQTFQFRAWEAMYVEMSRKFDMQGIKKLANDTGFELAQNFFDKKAYFVNSFWTKIKN